MIGRKNGARFLSKSQAKQLKKYLKERSCSGGQSRGKGCKQAIFGRENGAIFRRNKIEKRLPVAGKRL